MTALLAAETFGAGDRLIDLAEVRHITGFSRTFVYESMAAGTFPKAIKIGPNAVRWIEREILAWVRDRIRDSRSHAA